MQKLLRSYLTLISLLLLLLTSKTFAGDGTITHLAQLPLTGGIADVWGYFDNARNREYAIVGFGIFVSGPDPNSGIHIVDVTDPQNPVLVTTITTVPGFDVKVWQNFLYTVSGNAFGQGGIVDISDPTSPQVVGTFDSSHNIFIDDQGFMYLECPGLRIYDLNADPTAPALVWNDNTSDCHDAAVIDGRLFDFHGGDGTNIYDISDRANPQLLGTIFDPNVALHHSGWTTKDGNYLYICDELADLTNKPADVTVWDISDLGNPTKVGQIVNNIAIVHNLYIIDDFAYVSYYTDGFHIYDVSDPTKPTLVDKFDTSPAFAQPGFNGAFGVYPFMPSGTIYVSDIETGLHVFSFDQLTSVASSDETVPTSFSLLQNYPNPFNPSTTITYELPQQSSVILTIYNTLGQPIRTLANREQPAGRYEIPWDGRDERGEAVSSGIYFYKLKAGNFLETRRMLFVK